MQFVISALHGYAIRASDAAIGTLSDVLFDDATWTAQWLVVETGTWLTHRKILLHPSTVDAVNDEQETIAVRLTKAEIEASPRLDLHEPVSLQMQTRLHAHDETGIVRGNCYSGESWPASTVTTSPFIRTNYVGGATAGTPLATSGDPHLRSVSSVTGYHVHATDGEIGHVEDFLVDHDNWAIRYLIVDTRNWWFGKHVLLTPDAVAAVSWSDREIRLDVGRDQVRESPPWAPVARLEEPDDHPLRSHSGWPNNDFRLLGGE